MKGGSRLIVWGGRPRPPLLTLLCADPLWATNPLKIKGSGRGRPLHTTRPRSSEARHIPTTDWDRALPGWTGKGTRPYMIARKSRIFAIVPP
jgi:hypothetical protein